MVCNEQLVLYCRGNTSSFSARLVALDNQGKSKALSECGIVYVVAVAVECILANTFYPIRFIIDDVISILLKYT